MHAPTPVKMAADAFGGRMQSVIFILSVISAFSMDLLVARPAKAHQIRLIIRSAFRERNDVMNFIHRDISSVLETFLAERVLVDIARSDALPCSAVSFAGRVAAGELLIVLIHQSLVLITVLLTVFAEVRAARVAAGTFWFSWHDSHFLV
jgi:hypothetical protein